MTDAELKQLAIDNNFEPTYELLQFGRMAIMAKRINELRMWENNIRSAVAKEREACAKVCDEQADKDGFEGCYANACAEAIRARK